MKKEKIEKTNELLSASSSALSIINSNFSLIPLISYIIKEVLIYNDPTDIEKRMNKLTEKLKKHKITNKEFKEKINSLTEHNKYAVKNNLKNILISCIPEKVDLYLEILIDLIMNESQEMPEELCEIVNSLNVNDLNLLKAIKGYLQEGSRITYEKMVIKKEKEVKEMQEEIRKKGHLEKFYDRNIIYEKDTIFWKDFATYCNIKGMNIENILVNSNVNDERLLLGRAFLKLENTGLLQLEFLTMPGTLSKLDVDRFHITKYGLELLKYI